MRLRTFNAPTMTQVMAQVRETLGDDAVIVSTYESRRGRGITVTAARDDAEEDAQLQAALEEAPGLAPRHESIAQALAYHGVPAGLAERLVSAARQVDTDDPSLALAATLDARFTFARLPDESGAPALLVGPPGAGKTVTAIKMAARRVMAGKPVHLITTDSVRSGAYEQLAAFAELMDTPLRKAATPDELRAELAKAAPGTQTIVDTPGTNPFNDSETSDLARFISAAGVDPVLVMAAGLDPLEAADMARVFGSLGARRLHVTRVDAARRLGSVLSAADAQSITLCEISITAFVAKGLSPINPVSLSRLLLRDPSLPEQKADYESVAQCQ
ncbi:MAG: GTP-binding protein [Proteobacteria bacterium]|nr:GTP-binding protein [Pseudomonadota bacterium]